MIAAVLRVVASSLSLSDLLSLPVGNTSLKIATGLEVLAWVFAAAAFGTALVAFLLRPHHTRVRVIALSAGLFAGYGVSLLAGALIELVRDWGFSQSWTFKASQCAGAAAGLSVAIAGALVVIGVLSSRPDRLLGWGSIALAGYFGLLAAAYSFELAGFLTFPLNTLPGEFTWGLGTLAVGQPS